METYEESVELTRTFVKIESTNPGTEEAEVFLSEDKIKELQIENVEATLKKDISAVCSPLPIYKKISQTIIRDKEFDKTTTNKIKR